MANQFSLVNDSTKWLRQREMGIYRRGYFSNDDEKNILYHRMRSTDFISNVDLATGNPSGRYGHGGIFGLGFSTDGSMLVAACERKSLLLFDPLSQSMIRNFENAHMDCVNSIKFLDNRLFASCSDDKTAKLWDLRYLNTPVRSFVGGHNAWVKNVEYIPSAGILLTSAFDGTIKAWDINNYREQQEGYIPFFNSRGLIRMCFTADQSKLIISTMWGYLFVVHNFDYHSFVDDFQDFKPNVYFMLSKLSDEPAMYRFRSSYGRRVNALTTSSRNIPELIIDFPKDNCPTNIPSLKSHPFGWCVLSRNTDVSEDAEWSCVHDIQLPPVDDLLDDEKKTSISSSAPYNADNCPRSQTNINSQSSAGNDSSRVLRLADMPPELIAEVVTVKRTARMSTGGYDPGYAPRFAGSTGSTSRNLTAGRRASTSAESTTLPVLSFRPNVYHRLTHFIVDSNVGRGFIKEQSFSSDGRIIASPFGYGVRLLAFDDRCRELSDVSLLRDFERRIWSDSDSGNYETRLAVAKKYHRNKEKLKNLEPVELSQVGFHMMHKSPVLCSEFSPTHYLLATGCYHGKVLFYQPVL